MNTAPSAYPLAWPYGRARTKRHASSQFRTGLPGAIKNVQQSLSAFGRDTGKPIKGIVVSSNVTLGVDKPTDSGVAVYFQWDDRQVCIAVDRYGKVQDNLQAIHHILEARRTEMRHGGIEIVRATFEGFKALPAPTGYRPWTEVLRVSATASEAEIKTAARDLAKTAHPDAGGSHDAMAAINDAKKQALSELSQ